MKIFFINTVCGVGSTGNIVTGLLDLAKADGHTGLVAYGYGQAKKVQPGEAYQTVSAAGYYAHNLLSRLTDHEGLFSAAATRALVKKIQEFDPDVIHLHNLHGHYVHYGILFDYLAKAGKPVVWTLHDCWAFTGHCTHFTAVGCQKWQSGCRDCSQLRQYPQCYTGGDAAKNYRRKQAAFTGIQNLTIVTPSRWLADQVKQSFLMDYPVQVIHNGIDLTIFKPTDGDFRQKYHCEDKFILLGVAFDWSVRKGLDVFIELSKRLDDPFQIVLVGTNEDVDKQLPPNIISIHRTENQAQLAGVYTAADLFINPTREEVLGLVNIEALACGTPVLTFRTGGSPECIDDSCGSVVPCEDIDRFEAEILRVAAERPFWPDACIRWVHAFDKDQRFREYIDLYKKVIK